MASFATKRLDAKSVSDSVTARTLGKLDALAAAKRGTRVHLRFLERVVLGNMGRLEDAYFEGTRDAENLIFGPGGSLEGCERPIG